MNKLGRPKGVKNAYRLGPDKIHEAEIMFVSGKTIPEIGKIMNLSSNNILYRHLEKEGWMEKREKFFQESTKKHLDGILSGSLIETEEILLDLKTIREKAMDPIDSGELIPKKYSEASQAYMDSIELERRLRTEALHVSFIQDVAVILKEEIQNPELLMKIGDRLRKLFETRQKQLTMGK